MRSKMQSSVTEETCALLRSSHQDEYGEPDAGETAEKNVMPAAGDLMAAMRNTTSSWKTERVKPLPETLALQKGDTSPAHIHAHAHALQRTGSQTARSVCTTPLCVPAHAHSCPLFGRGITGTIHCVRFSRFYFLLCIVCVILVLFLCLVVLVLATVAAAVPVSGCRGKVCNFRVFLVCGDPTCLFSRYRDSFEAPERLPRPSR